jgi:hypothetical protein
VPWALKRAYPVLSPVVDIAAGAYDYLVRPELHANDPSQPPTFDSVGAKRFGGWLRRQADGVFVIVGATGSGKTALMCAIADRWAATASHLYIVGVSASALEGTPLEPFSWSAERIRRLPKRSVLLVPDSGMYLDSRKRTAASDMVGELIWIARHREIRIVLDVQFSSALEKRAELFKALFYKWQGDSWEALEREEFRRYARLAYQEFQKIPIDEVRRYAFVFCNDLDARFRGFISSNPPDWYSDQISRSHSDDVIDAEFRILEDDEG